jgi:hypothetical protein
VHLILSKEKGPLLRARYGKYHLISLNFDHITTDRPVCIQQKIFLLFTDHTLPNRGTAHQREDRILQYDDKSIHAIRIAGTGDDGYRFYSVSLRRPRIGNCGDIILSVLCLYGFFFTGALPEFDLEPEDHNLAIDITDVDKNFFRGK